MKAIRVLHCPTMVGGNPQGLARAERALGLDSISVAFEKKYFDYNCDEILWKDNDSYPQKELKRWQLLFHALKDFDIIHFNFGRSIFPHVVTRQKSTKYFNNALLGKIYALYSSLLYLRDLPLLKKAGKGIVVTYQGSDARQEGYYRKCYGINFTNELLDPAHFATEDIFRCKGVTIFSKYADRIFSLNPDLLCFLPKDAQFIPYAHIDLDEWRAVPRKCSSSPIVVHAPSNRNIKGTSFILEAVSRLKAEGINFEFILIEGMPHKEARKIYEKADLFIDQLLIGWYGGFAVEGMALSKAIISYIRQEDLKFIPSEMGREIPIINANAHTLYEVLKEWLTLKKSELADKGRLGRAYVEKWHDPLKVAAMLKNEYEMIIAGKKVNK